MKPPSATTGAETAADPAPAPRRARVLRGLLRALVLVVVLLGILGAALALWLPGRSIALPDWAERRIEARAQQALAGLRLGFDDLSVTIARDWRPNITLHGVALRDEAGTEIARLTRLDAGLSMRGLLQREVRLRDLRLEGAFLSLRRDRDGSFDLAFGAALPAAERAPSLAALVGGIDALLERPQLATLRRAEVEAVTLTYADARAGRRWTVDGGRLRLARSGPALRDLRIEGDFALLGGGAQAATLQAFYASRMGSAEMQAGVNISDMAAGDIAAQSPALAWLGALRAPISGALRVSTDAAGALGPLNASLQIGPGVLQPRDETAPLPFEEARTYFTYLPQREELQFDEISLKSAWITATAEGRAVLDGLSEGWPETLLGQFRLARFEANPDNTFAVPLDLGGAAADFRLRLDPFVLDLGQLVLGGAAPPLRLSGKLAAQARGWEVALDGQLTQLDAARLLDYWPPAFKPRSRNWYAANVLEGTLRRGQFSWRGRPGAPPVLYLGAEFTGASALYMKTLPPIEEGAGRLVLSGNRLAVVAEAGRVRAPRGGMVDIAGSTLVIPDVRIPDPPARIDLKTDSTITAMLSLLDEPPFRLLSRAGREVTLADGRAALSAGLDLRLMKQMPREMLRFDVWGRLTGVESRTLVPGRVLAAPELSLRADPAGLEIAGRGRLGRVPFDGSFALPISLSGPPPGAPAVQAEVELSERFLDEFGIALPAGAVTGQGAGRLRVDLPKGRPPAYTLSSDLSGLRLRLAPLGWGKPPGQSGSLVVRGALGAPATVEALELTAAGLRAEGRIELTEGGKLRQAVFDRVRLGGWLDAPVRLRPAGAGLAAEVPGGRVDLRALPRGGGGGAPGAGGGAGNGLPLRLALDRLVVLDGLALHDFRSDLSTAGGLTGDFTGRVNGGALVTGRVVPQNGGSAVELRAGDAGGVLRSARLMERVRGGDLRLWLVPTGDGPGHYDGRLVVEDARLRDAPAMAELLSALSIVGLLEQLGGQGIAFTEVEARFRLTPGQLILSHASAFGPSLGLSLNGFYDIARQRMDLQGVLSPLYLVNGVGSLFSRKGEGLFGFNFTLKGDKDAPEVGVNPLSVLTPGLFREIFRRPPPELE